MISYHKKTVIQRIIGDIRLFAGIMVQVLRGFLVDALSILWIVSFVGIILMCLLYIIANGIDKDKNTNKSEVKIMKKLFTRLLALAFAALLIVSLAACNSNGNTPAANDSPAETAADSADTPAADASASGILGSWEYESGGYTYTFNADGTGTYDVSGTIMNFTYEASDTTLSILYDGNTEPMELEYILDGDTLNVKDSFGSDTIYKRK